MRRAIHFIQKALDSRCAITWDTRAGGSNFHMDQQANIIYEASDHCYEQIKATFAPSTLITT